MPINTKLTLSCANKDCKKTHVIEGANATRAQLYKASKKDGWQWKNAEVQYCPTHKIVKVVKVKTVKVAKPVSASKSLKVATVAKRAPNAAPKKVTTDPKPAPSWTPAPAPTVDGEGALA